MEVMAEILSDAADTLQVCCVLSTRCQYPLVVSPASLHSSNPRHVC